MLPFLIALVFAAGVLFVVGIALLLFDRSPRQRYGDSLRLHQEFLDHERLRDPESPLFKDLSQLAAESAALEASTRKSIHRQLDNMIEQAGMEVKPRTLYVVGVASGLLLGAATCIFLYLIGRPIYLGLIPVLPAFAVPFFYIHFRRNKRWNAILAQLPDALDTMVSAMRAGRSMTEAMQEVSNYFKPPLGAEFQYCISQQDLGMSPEAALRDLSRRTGLLEIKIFSLTLLIQRQTGGNFAALLTRLSQVVRQRFRVKGQVQALTAEGRLQANVLIVLPPLVFAITLFMSPSYAQVLLDRPLLLLATAGSMVFGMIWIRRIVNFDF